MESSTAPGRLADGLRRAVDDLLAADLDATTDDQLRTLLTVVQSALDRLSGFRARATGVVERRAIYRAGPGREQQALRAVRETLADELRLPASEVKRAGQTGRRLEELPAAQDAMTEGALSGDHARILAETLTWIDDESVRDAAERRLLEAAAAEDVRAFATTCRRELCAVDASAAQRRIDRQHARRSLRATTTEDGSFALHARGVGLDAEIVQTALQAFRVPDLPGVARTPDQRGWDALVTVCRTSLDAGTAATNRSVRPHVLVTVHEPVVAGRLDARRDVAETAWSGPLPWTEVRRLLADADVSRVLIDADRLPIEVGAAVRTVPAGLWKALLVRDVTCIADGCTAPAAWCDVMHLDVPYRLQGRLSLDTAGLGCRYHHRRFDRGGWQVTWFGRRPVIHHPSRPPTRPATPGRLARSEALTSATGDRVGGAETSPARHHGAASVRVAEPVGALSGPSP